MQILLSIRDKIAALLSQESGQDTFEYLLIIGGISVVVIGVVALASPGLIGAVVEGVCDEVMGVLDDSAFDCTTL